jgi:predicted transcriptional regulator
MPQIQGDLQAQIMTALWRLESGTVEQVRSGLPARYRGAYTTVQTVLNRLAERGLLVRSQRGNALVYTPKLTEAEYVSDSIEQTLAGASTHARQAAIAQLLGELDSGEITALRRRARELERKRAQP